MINKTSLKFIAGFVAIIGVALASLYFFQTYFSPEKRAERKLAELERLYAEDTYGGQTPEETLQLFIDALKAGDIDLASKYFVIEDREKSKQQLLNEQKIDSVFEHLIAGLSKLERTVIKDSSQAFFVITDKNNVVTSQVTFGKNINGTWKIVDM